MIIALESSRMSVETMGESIPLTSTPLALDTDSNYTNYLTNVLSETDHDQHSRNLMIQTYGSDSIAMCGTNQIALFHAR